jgi:hypothetical protein
MVKKLIFTLGTILLTFEICFCRAKNDIHKNPKMLIYQCFLDDVHSILDNLCVHINELIIILNGPFFDQKHDFLTNKHVLIEVGF